MLTHFVVVVAVSSSGGPPYFKSYMFFGIHQTSGIDDI